jgi:hypothetical protein
MKDTSKPVVKFTKGEFYKSRYSFFARKDSETISFIINIMNNIILENNVLKNKQEHCKLVHYNKFKLYKN